MDALGVSEVGFKQKWIYESHNTTDALRKWYAQKTVHCEVWHLLEQRFFSPLLLS